MLAANKAEFQSQSTHERFPREGRHPILAFQPFPLFVYRISPVAL